ncbi:sensor histidine kinase [Wenzhouxiangella sediminis]|uniref:histidine kinase n=1 Tax=Wenzhouxiangella sediminis TaxID=1792836 RepID=A0A3E1K5T6_9GAMM|nr:sensor histidine kinase [Wenzhouxiangella sediminis]RFF29375.1 sensor histidine kinase [Wenzhouxiangella sediminis]
MNRPLPAAVAVGGPRRWLSYRTYPVFSWPWVRRRALLFGLLIVAWGGLSGVMHYAGGGSAGDAALVFAAFVFGAGVMVNAGPVLAALVRHRRMPARRERALVVVALGLGLALAFLADMQSSALLAELSGTSFERELGAGALAINLLVLLVIYAFVGGGLALRAYLGEERRLADYQAEREVRRLQSEKLAADQQLAMLQAQIEPHFLFNTLATVRSSLRGDPNHAEATLDALCDYLRTTIPRLRRDETGSLSTVEEQLEICRRYLAVMKQRMGERLDYEVHAESGAGALGFPPFILLSLVENAIRHGLEPKPGGGRIDIAARRENEHLRISVEDSGVGFSPDSGSGVGLDNIRRQLKLRYGEGARLRLESSPAGGVRATMIIPLEPAS